MFDKEDIKIPDNNIDSVIKEETEDFDTSSIHHGLSKIKYEFDEGETMIQNLENQLTEKNVDDLQFFDGEFSRSAQKIETTTNVMFSKKTIKIEEDEVDSQNTDKHDEINTYLDSSNIKSEFKEETKIQYGVFENQLHEEIFDNTRKDINTFRILDGDSTKSFQKTELFSKQYIESARSHKTDPTIFFNNKSHTCEYCDQCFNTMETLNIHGTICGAGPYKCEISVKKVDQHNTPIKENVYKCETCNKCFRAKKNLKVHMKIHTEEKHYKCETCGKCFVQHEHLNVHNRTHTGEKPYICETCGKCFVQQVTLIRHNRTHTGEKPYKCETCGKCYADKGTLNGHNRIHTGAKPYKCETCDKCFGQLGTLILHNRTHSGEKPHKCNTCGKSFVVKSILESHNRTHTGEKPYKCETCGKCFTQKGTLKLHHRTHEREAL